MNWKNMLLLFSCFLMVTNGISPVVYSAQITGFNKGVSCQPVVPLKKITFVNFDEQGFLDDYAFLAAVPTTVFSDGSKLFSYPLLYYQDPYPVKEDKERSLNARQGLDYFMEDWMSYCNGRLDGMTLINVPEEKVKQWPARNITVLNDDDPYHVAAEIALTDWSYSDNAVVAVIQENFKKPGNVTENIVKGTLPAYNVAHKHFKIDQPTIGTGGTYKSFSITDENYKYITAQLSWNNRIDLDLQLYDKQLGMMDNAAKDYTEHAAEGLIETVGTYIHNYGEWQVSVTAVPKKGMYRMMKNDGFKPFFEGSVKQGDVDLFLYPGTIVDIPHTPFGCRNAEFTLRWNNPTVQLGFTLLDPAGTEIYSSLSLDTSSSSVDEKKNEESIHISQLGECRDNENYSICVFSLGNISQPVDFTIEYKWYQNFSKIESDCFTSASNGAVLASVLNIPLLYTASDCFPASTKNTLLKLGVKNIYLVNIGGHLSKKTADEIKNTVKIKEAYTAPSQIYTAIKNLTGENTVVFTTIDPWTYWYVLELKPAGEYPSALYVGPAAYIAAHHGCPVLIVDEHPELSQAVVYPTDFWKKNADERVLVEPCSGSMVLFGKQVYQFLEENNLGKLEEGGAAEQIKETIITVAGQYDIGVPWDRSFTGAAYPGRFFGSPVDTAYFIARNVFYPALIFVNPASGEVKLINGSSSKIQRFLGRLREPFGINLVITNPSQEKTFRYPILHTYNVFLYKFNEGRGRDHWNFKYTRADGIIPYFTDSLDPIDDGVTDKSGAYYPDMSETEVIPFYAKKAGYSNCFSTNFSATVTNLNRGVLIWVEECHGYHTQGGKLAMWDPESPYAYENNPWRAYETILLTPGNLREFIHWLPYYAAGDAASDLELSESQIARLKQLSMMLLRFHFLGERGSTEDPDVSVVNPQLTRLNKLFRMLSGGVLDCWGAFGVMIHRDRLLHPFKTISAGLPFITTGDGKVIISPLSGRPTTRWMTGYDFDNALENLHSCGLNTISCMPALTYLHLTWMRHGMVYQIIDPWTTTDWAAVWNQMLVKRFAMGDTIGEAYERGMRACGPEFLVGQWWWDIWENVELFGDPNLRPFVPGVEYSDANYWTNAEVRPLCYDEQFQVDGHMPFGVTSHPHRTSPPLFSQSSILLMFFLLLLFLFVLLGIILRWKK